MPCPSLLLLMVVPAVVAGSKSGMFVATVNVSLEAWNSELFVCLLVVCLFVSTVNVSLEVWNSELGRTKRKPNECRNFHMLGPSHPFTLVKLLTKSYQSKGKQL